MRFIYRPDRNIKGSYYYGYTAEGSVVSPETDPNPEPIAEWAARIDAEQYELAVSDAP